MGVLLSIHIFYIVIATEWMELQSPNLMSYRNILQISNHPNRIIIIYSTDISTILYDLYNRIKICSAYILNNNLCCKITSFSHLQMQFKKCYRYSFIRSRIIFFFYKMRHYFIYFFYAYIPICINLNQIFLHVQSNNMHPGSIFKRICDIHQYILSSGTFPPFPPHPHTLTHTDPTSLRNELYIAYCAHQM